MLRWCGPFANANIAALETALVAVAALAIAAHPLPRCGRLAVPLRLVAALAAAGAIALTGLTGSRAGALALVAGLASLAALHALPWRWLLAGLLAAGAAVALGATGSRLLPAGVDASVSARLVLWQATLALIADHPWSGVGAQLPDLLATWYLPDGYRTRFATALNEGLTVAASWGLPALAVAAGLGAGLLACAVADARRGSLSAAIASAGCAVHLVAGMFQAHLFAPWGIARWSGLAILVLLLAAAWRSAPPWRRTALCAAAAAAASVLTVGLLALICAEAPWRTARHGSAWLATPRHAPSAGLVVLPHHAADFASAADSLLPQLSAAGLAVLPCAWTPDAPPWNGLGGHPRTLVMGGGDLGLLLWQMWRDGGLPPGVDAVVIDPDGLPARPIRPSAGRGRLLVATVAGNSIPDPSALREAAAIDNRFGDCTSIEVVGCNWRDAWPPVQAWWRPVTPP